MINQKSALLRQSILILIFLIFTVLLTYGKVLNYPFVQDDWGWIYRFKNNDLLSVFKMIFNIQGKTFFRPLGQAYFLFMFKFFGMNPLPYHLSALMIHVINAFFVYLIIKKIFANNLLAISTGILYSTASVHLDPLIWVVGIYELGTTFFFLLAFFLFLNKKYIFSALAYLISISFKESSIILPFILVAYHLYKNNSFKIKFKRFISTFYPYLIVIGIYGIIKLHAESVLSMHEKAPYAIRFFGVHLLKNAYLYCVWSFQSIFPYSITNNWKLNVGLFIAFLVVFFIFIIFLLKADYKKNKTKNLKPFLFLFVWFGFGLAPVFFMPNHSYRYYLTLSLPSFITAFLYLTSIGNVSLKKNFNLNLVILVSVISLISTTYNFHKINNEGINQSHLAVGTNRLVKRGKTVDIVKKGLYQYLPEIPDNAVLLFLNLNVWSFNKQKGPKVWYSNDTIEVYDSKYLRADKKGLYLDNPAETQREVYTGGKLKKIYLNKETTFIFLRKGTQLIPVKFDTLKNTLLWGK